MYLMWLMQAHHLDTDYYDRFFRPGAYESTHAAHMAKMAPLASDGAFRPRKVRRADQSDLAVVQRISADAYIAAYVPMLGYIPLPAEEDYRPRIERGEVWLLECGDSDVGLPCWKSVAITSSSTASQCGRPNREGVMAEHFLTSPTSAPSRSVSQ
jgi:hypothetical protein